MSLILPEEKMWDMPIGGNSQDRQIPHLFGNLAFGVVGAICKVCFRYRVDGRENLRAFKGRSGALVVCNHTSYLDVVFVYLAARSSQWVRLLGKESLFYAGGKVLGQMLSRVGAFPIKRDTSDRKAIKRAARNLKNQELVGIFPEGTRRDKGNKVPKMHAGAAFIAKMGKAPILPMTVRNAQLVKQKGKMLRFPKITVEYGTPVLVSDFDALPKDERLDGCTWYVMRECFAMFYDCAPEDVDMKGLFPEAKDYSAYFAENPVPRRTTKQLLDEMEAAKRPKDAGEAADLGSGEEGEGAAREGEGVDVGSAREGEGVASAAQHPTCSASRSQVS